MRPQAGRIWRGVALFAAVFAFGLVMFGAFVRLSDAGLSCPDWPTCYGKATWPTQAHDVARADLAFPERPVEHHKAWREQVHRMLAGTLGVLVLALALGAAWRERWARVEIGGAALAAAIGVALYMRGEHVVSSVLGALAIALPVWTAWRLRAADGWRIAALAFAVIVFQAMLGMWTVTWLLKPIVVMGHLLGGMATLALLVWIALRFFGVGEGGDEFRAGRGALIIGIVVVVAQIALGGWVSSNYAALACGYGDAAFPECFGAWWPAQDYREAFVLWRGIGVDYEGGVLDLAARTAIQMTHRIGAIVVTAYLAWLAWRLQRAGWSAHALAIALALVAQIGLGIANVHYGLPLAVATLHNGVAALLLLSLVAALARLTPCSRTP